MKYLLWFLVMFMAFCAWAEEPDFSSATCLKLNREVKAYLRSGIDLPLDELTLFHQTRNRLIEGFEARLYSLNQLSTAMYELSRDARTVVRACQRKGSRKFVDMLPESVQELLLTAAGTSKPLVGR